ncbi:MAG: phosphate signaling complex protein PhoU [Phycisphaerae bacterium]|jgi:phosphate transport system protein
MLELQKNLEKLTLRLERMGLRVAEAVNNAFDAIAQRDVTAGEWIDEDDSQIDQEEVAIEKECINLLALYQPAAIDLRRICCVIKVNNDLERIADIAARLGRRVKHLVAGNIALEDYADYGPMVHATRDILRQTVRMLNSADADLPRQVIEADRQLDAAYAAFTREVLDAARRSTDVDTALTAVLLARSLERIGDHCTNIAEDVFFLNTGDIVRHSAAFKAPADE